jgi:hypothetical protein
VLNDLNQRYPRFRRHRTEQRPKSSSGIAWIGQCLDLGFIWEVWEVWIWCILTGKAFSFGVVQKPLVWCLWKRNLNDRNSFGGMRVKEMRFSLLYL